MDEARVATSDPETTITTTIVGTGEPEDTGDGGPATEAPIFLPGALVFDSSNNLYLGDCCGKVRRIDAETGIIEKFAGGGPLGVLGDGGPATEAYLSSMGGLATDPDDNVYITDRGNHRIRLVDGTGIISTVAGGGSIGDGIPATSAHILFPRGLDTDPDGNLIIADAHSLQVRRLDRESGRIETIARHLRPLGTWVGGAWGHAATLTFS